MHGHWHSSFFIYQPQICITQDFGSNPAFVLFDLFTIIDGTGDPAIGEWSEAVIIDRPEDYTEDHEMLHDEFFSTGAWTGLFVAIDPRKDILVKS